MKSRSFFAPFLNLWLVPVLFVPLVGKAQQTFTDFQAASVVAGQANFTNQVTTASQTVTPGPTSVAISATGKMVVGEQSGRRALIWNSVPTTNGAAADVVVGQVNFTTTTAGVTSSRTSSVEGVTFSPDGSKLIVCDTGNRRVLIWNSVPTTSGQAADVVIGQTDFTSNTSGVAADKFAYPAGVLVTPAGKLVVTDRGNNRVLIFNSIPTSNGASADVVIGQAGMTTNSSGSGANQMAGPWGCAFSSDGKLLVTDQFNNRVLVFNALPTTNGASANVVVGQTTFGVSTGGTTSSNLSDPIGVAVSSAGQLSIGEFSNDRVLIYNSIPTSNGAVANVVLGQPNFTSNASFNGGVGAQSMRSIYQLTYAADGRLLVSGRDMKRVMIFGTPGISPTVTAISPTSGSTAGGTSVTITGTGLTGATGVTIGGTAATGVSVVSATSITCTTAAHAAGTASVLVTTPGGTNAANTLFTYVAPPTVTAISPTSGSTAGGTPVTITGTGFTGATGVTIGGTAATGVSVVSATSITCTTAAHAAGTASVLVTTPGGTNAANTLFTYTNTAPTSITLSATSLAENSAANSIVGTLSSTDVDLADTFTYTLVSGLGSTDNAAFTITGSALTTNGSPDYEAKSSYAIRVRTTDQGGLFVEQTFTVSIINVNEAPTIQMPPSPVIVEASSASGAVATYSVSGTDPEQGALTGSGVPASGSTFPLGDTTVNASVTDSVSLTANGSFIVRVLDTTAPAVATHANLTVEATSLAGAVVNYAAGSATDAVGVTSLTYSQNSGTTFPIGLTTVTITAKDAANNTGTSSFTVTVTASPEIAVEQPASTNIGDGGTNDFGTVNVGSNTSLTFTIKNTGTADLTGLTITKDGTNQSDFTVTANPTAPVSGPSGTTTFTVRFAPSGGGPRTAAIHIANNDSNENPFDINLTGTGFQTTYVWNGGGATNNWSEGANWVGGGAPTNDGTKDIVFGASSRYTSQVDAPWAVRSIVFGSGRASDYTVQGSALTVGSGGIEARDAAGRYVTITNAMTLAASQTWRQFATTYNLRFDGPISLGGQTLSVTSEYPGSGGVGVRLAGNITGTGNLILNPGTNIYVDGSHSYVGTLTCNYGGGNVHVSSPDAFPGIVNNANESIIFNASHTNNRTISGTGSIWYDRNQNYTITGSNNYSGRTVLGVQGTPQLTLASATPFGSGYVMAWYRGGGISGDSARTFANQLAFAHDADVAFTFGGSFPLTFTGGAKLGNTARAVVTAPSLTIQGVVSTWFGTSNLVKEGVGTLILSGATPNTYTGNTAVKAGTLSLSKSAGTAAIATGVLSVEPSASVSWAASDQIANGVNVVMSGGELNLGGRSETMGTLDLDGAAELDFGTVAGSAAAAFSNSSAPNWTGGNLTVSGFVPGTTTLRFGTNATGLSATQLSLIQFAGFASGAQINSAGYVTPPGFTPPTYAGYSFSTSYQTAATISFAKLLTMAADADGDALSITAAGSSANGGTVTMQASSLLYTPPNSFSGIDTFQITITDADGLWVIGTVTATVQTSNSGGGASSNTPVLTALSGGTRMGISFQGIPGRPYEVQRSTDMALWQVLTTVTAATNGAVTFIDESPAPGSAFYRLRKP